MERFKAKEANVSTLLASIRALQEQVNMLQRIVQSIPKQNENSNSGVSSSTSFKSESGKHAVLRDLLRHSNDFYVSGTSTRGYVALRNDMWIAAESVSENYNRCAKASFVIVQCSDGTFRAVPNWSY